MTLLRSKFVRARIACALILGMGALCLASPARAQSTRPVLEVAGRDTLSSMVALGTRLRIRSGILHETREVIVAVPPGYERGREKFPVLYVLDGGQNLLTTVSASRALAGAGRMPPVIVVAIANTQRDRDFTPKLVRTTEPPPELSAFGGADAFLAFVGTELIPAVDAKYRTQPMRTIIGHSLGGLVAMHALATTPGLFRGYLTLEPSLWWDARQPVQSVLDSLRAHPAAVGRLVAVEGTSDDGWKPDWVALGNVAPAHFRTSFIHVENESHENLPYRGIYEGLASLFADYMPAMRHDLSQATLAALEAQYGSMSRDFGYNVNPPLSAFLNIANREANQRRFASARRALAMADSLYPGSSDTKSFRGGLEAAAAEASRSGLEPGEALWIVPSRGVHTWGMRFTIDVLALDQAGKVIDCVSNLRPWRVRLPRRGTAGVLELPAGTLAASQTSLGDQVLIELAGREA